MRQLYMRLLQKTQHPRVWESFARFELSQGNVEEARQVYLTGFDGPLKNEDTKQQRYELLELWKEFEEDVADKFGEEVAKLDMITTRVPKRIKKKRKITTADGVDAGFEEYHDFLFPGLFRRKKKKMCAYLFSSYFLQRHDCCSQLAIAGSCQKMEDAKVGRRKKVNKQTHVVFSFANRTICFFEPGSSFHLSAACSNDKTSRFVSGSRNWPHSSALAT